MRVFEKNIYPMVKEHRDTLLRHKGLSKQSRKLCSGLWTGMVAMITNVGIPVYYQLDILMRKSSSQEARRNVNGSVTQLELLP